MNIRLAPNFILSFFLLTGSISAQSIREQEPVFSVEQLKSDLQYLRKNIEEKHPNLYLYTEKNELDFAFDSLLNGITKPLTVLEFYKHITFISYRINTFKIASIRFSIACFTKI